MKHQTGATGWPSQRGGHGPLNPPLGPNAEGVRVKAPKGVGCCNLMNTFRGFLNSLQFPSIYAAVLMYITHVEMAVSVVLINFCM